MGHAASWSRRKSMSICCDGLSGAAGLEGEFVLRDS
jgi:hypothetical protein